MYCVKCKRETETINIQNVISKNKKPMLRGVCAECGRIKTRFVSTAKKGGDLVGSLNSVTSNIKLPWAKFPGELHLPGHSFTGPGTRLDLRLNPDGTPKDWSTPVDRVDKAAYTHDLAYNQYSDTASRNAADRLMVTELNNISNPTIRERIERAIVKPILSTKANLGLGLASSDSKTPPKWTDKLADELHRPVVRHFPKRKVYVKAIDQIWAADLIDMQAFAEYNDGVKYLLSVIDIFSKYGFIVPLKDKSGKSVFDAFIKIFKTSGRKPEKLWIDKGKEFYNKDVKSLGVELYSTENEEKSSIIERWNRTMKEQMFKYFTANSTRKYIDVLESMVNKYNNTRHSSIKMTPTKASTKANETIVWKNLYGDLNPEPPSKPKFSVGDKVRISKKKKFFEKGYTPRWTEEVFSISQVQYTDPPTYKIADSNGEEIQGSVFTNRSYKRLLKKFIESKRSLENEERNLS